VIPGLRHNLLALGVDHSVFMIGLSFASQATILPAFAAHLGAANVVIGAIPAVMTLGWFLPSLFAAGHTEALGRKLPFVVRYTVWERAPFLVLALAAFLLAERAPAVTLAVLLLMLLTLTGVGGVLMPAWMDIIGRAIPVTVRGRFFAGSSLVAGVGGFAGSFLTARILSTVPAPASYGVCFLCAAACMAVSFAALVLVREPPAAAAAPPVALRAYLARVPALLRRDRNLRWFLLARALGMIGGIGNGFYTVYALAAWAPPDSQVGVFTALLLVGQVAGTVTLGWLADRAGHRLVLVTGLAAMVGASALALAAPSLEAFGGVFVLAGVQGSAITISNLNVLLEFAPSPEERPTYIGLGTTSLAPVAFGAPLVAGLLADAWGFAAVFGVAVAAGTIALIVLTGMVTDPRETTGQRVTQTDQQVTERQRTDA
jgi:MFS family permease